MGGIYEEIERISAEGEDNAWLKEFSTPIDTLIAEILGGVDVTPLIYDPCAFDAHLVSASERLDVCLMRRRDIVELLDRAVRQNLDIALFEQLRIQDDKLDSSSSLQGQTELAKTSSMAAAAAFGKGDDAVAKGLRASADGAVSVATDTATRDQERIAALQSRASLQREHYERLASFSETPGHPINYEHRVKRVMTLLADDITDAYQKLVATHAGMKACMDIDLPLPRIEPISQNVKSEGKLRWEPTNVLDALILWTREAARRIERSAAKEVTVTLQVPLVQKMSRDGAADPTSFVETTAKFHEAFGGKEDKGDGLFLFELNDEAFPGMDKVRLTAIGATILPKDSAAFKLNESTGCRVLVDAPERKDGRDSYEGAPKRSILLGIANREMAGLAVADAIRNADPRGTWRVKVLRGIAAFGAAQIPRMDAMEDVRLVIRVVGTIKKGAAG